MLQVDKISIPKLIGTDNYLIWSIRTSAVFQKDGIDLKDLLSLTESQSLKVLATIQLLCADGPLLHIKDCKTPTEAWTSLKQLYNPQGFTTEFLICKDFFSTTLQEFDSMEAYLNKVKELLNSLSSHEISLPNQVVIAWILHSIGSEYEGLISNIVQDLRKDPKAYIVDSLFSSLIDEARGKEKNSVL